MDKKTIHTLKRFTLFESLDNTLLSEIFGKLEEVTIEANHILFRQGETSDYLYLLVEGRLEASLVTINHEKKIIGNINPGETVGEMGAMLDRPRTLTIKALKDSALLKLSADEFKNIIFRFPSVMIGSLHSLIERSTSLIDHISENKKQKHIAILCANKDTNIDMFCNKLRTIMHDAQDTIVISDKDYYNNITIDSLNQKHIVYCLQSLDEPLAEKCIPDVDVFYLISNSEIRPSIDKKISTKINTFTFKKRNEIRLILLQSDSKNKTSTHTEKWLAQMDFVMHHFVRINYEKDYLRLIRFMLGKPVGLVLGGGGARGWVHIGTIKAMQELNIPIDIIGGTSVGSLVAAYYAEHENYEELVLKFKAMTEAAFSTFKIKNLLWPKVGLYNRNTYISVLKKHFNEKRIEDLVLPVFCISSNLANCSEETHKTGLIWEKICASTAIPGMLPAICINGQLHYDGGLLNNLPTDVMRNIIGNDGTIIAVDLGSYKIDKTFYKIPSVLYFYQTLLARFFPRYGAILCPPLIDTFMQSLMMGSTYKIKLNATVANFKIAPSLADYGVYKLPEDKIEKLIDLGYQTAMQELKNLAGKVKT